MLELDFCSSFNGTLAYAGETQTKFVSKIQVFIPLQLQESHEVGLT